MGKLFGKLRIGEKIGLSFGLVGLLFLGVVWHYHDSLNRVLAGYEGLHDVYETRKSHALDIEVQLAETRQAENDFLIHREARFASAVDANASALLQSSDALAQVDQDSRQTAQEIRQLTETYLGRFRDIAEAWQVKGLDHNAGLQGAFRDTVHELEDRAGNFKAGRLYLQLLQIRRGEKDLGLRRETLYRDKVRGLISEFRGLVQSSELYPEVKESLMAEIDVYARAFESYSEIVLSGGELRGGKGPFRDSAHRLEALLEAHYVPDLETNILQLRRREKDYLLRNDPQYVQMVQGIADTIRGQVAISPISDPDKVLLRGLLGDYERDFNALVAQNDRIEDFAAAMREAAENITPLVKRNVQEADYLAGEKAPGDCRDVTQEFTAEPDHRAVRHPSRDLLRYRHHVAHRASGARNGGSARAADSPKPKGTHRDSARVARRDQCDGGVGQHHGRSPGDVRELVAGLDG